MGGAPPSYDPFPLPAQTHDHGDPSPLEQALLEEIQRARADPAAEGPYLVGHREAQNAIAQFGVNTAQLVAEFESYPPAPPLAYDPLLADAAAFHSDDMATAGYQGHVGTAGDTLGDRVTAAGYPYASVAENVFASANSIVHCHLALAIDWGVPNLGHRINILDLEQRRRHIGISVIVNPSSPAVGPFVVTQDFGRTLDDEDRYLVGVVYSDTNNDGNYDPGEGLPDMLIVPDTGTLYAITSSSGGYAIPFLPNAGPMAVQLQTDAGEALYERPVVIVDENVKVDFSVD
jgi:uncharacterized protein YkwD